MRTAAGIDGSSLLFLKRAAHEVSGRGANRLLRARLVPGSTRPLVLAALGRAALAGPAALALAVLALALALALAFLAVLAGGAVRAGLAELGLLLLRQQDARVDDDLLALLQAGDD